MAKTYKRNKRGGARFVQLNEYLQATDAWATMNPGPRALYVELKRRFNGSNNGEIILSHREAAKALNVNRDTATRYFEELLERRFIRQTGAPHLGPAGIGQASKWALEELPTPDGKTAGKAFARWTPNLESPPKNWDTPSQKTGRSKAEVIELTPNRPKKTGRIWMIWTIRRPKKRDVFTYSHRHWRFRRTEGGSPDVRHCGFRPCVTSALDSRFCVSTDGSLRPAVGFEGEQ